VWLIACAVWFAGARPAFEIGSNKVMRYERSELDRDVYKFELHQGTYVVSMEDGEVLWLPQAQCAVQKTVHKTKKGEQ
jgi:hypothetical protein